MPNITRATVIPFMRQAIRKFAEGPARSSNNYWSTLMNMTLLEMADAGVVRLPNREDAWNTIVGGIPPSELGVVLTETFHHLLALGYVVPRPSNSGGPKLDFVSVTPSGIEWAAIADPIPEDTEGFLASLESRVRGIDPVLKLYLAEGLSAYSRQTFFAAAVMLGAASEAALYLLADAVVASHIGSAPERTKLSRAVERHRPAEILELTLGAVGKARMRQSNPMPYAVHEGTDHHLGSLLENIRVQRNEAGHPTVGKVNPVSLRLAFSAFPAACRKVYDIVGWFKAD